MEEEVEEEPERDEDDEDEEDDEEYQLKHEANKASLRHARIPFGPFISLAALEVLVFQDIWAVLFPYLWD